MADLNNNNRTLMLMRYEHQLATAKVQIQARNIRVMELEDEILRNKDDIIAQEKIIEEMQFNISQQQELILKEK